MGERTSHAPGTFSWTDLGTSDADAAKRFYGELFGWDHEDMPAGPDMTYTMLRKDGREVGALYQSQQGPPAWLSYVTVEDVDAGVARVGELGGAVISEPMDVFEAGRMAVVQDPQRAVFALWQPRQSIGATLVNDPGAMCMNSLATTDTAAAERFYADLFGWRAEQVSQEPPFWSLFNGDRLNGGMSSLPQGDGAPPPHWLVYFTVEDLDGAARQIGDGGGEVIVPPMEIPAGRILVARDPQGAHFALFEGEIDP